MAEFAMKDLVRDAGLEEEFQIASAATSLEDVGNPIYPPARRILSEYGIPFMAHTARRLCRDDYERYDLLIGMDNANLFNMRRICGGDHAGKMHLLMEYAGYPDREVADPWYTRDFHTAMREILAGCRGLLRKMEG